MGSTATSCTKEARYPCSLIVTLTTTLISTTIDCSYVGMGRRFGTFQDNLCPGFPPAAL